MTLPVAVADYDYGICAWLSIFLRIEKAPERRLNAERAEVVPSRFVAIDTEIFAGVNTSGSRDCTGTLQGWKSCVPVAKIYVIGIGHTQRVA